MDDKPSSSAVDPTDSAAVNGKRDWNHRNGNDVSTTEVQHGQPSSFKPGVAVIQPPQNENDEPPAESQQCDLRAHQAASLQIDPNAARTKSRGGSSTKSSDRRRYVAGSRGGRASRRAPRLFRSKSVPSAETTQPGSSMAPRLAEIQGPQNGHGPVESWQADSLAHQAAPPQAAQPPGRRSLVSKLEALPNGTHDQAGSGGNSVHTRSVSPTADNRPTTSSQRPDQRKEQSGENGAHPTQRPRRTEDEEEIVGMVSAMSINEEATQAGNRHRGTSATSTSLVSRPAGLPTADPARVPLLPDDEESRLQENPDDVELKIRCLTGWFSSMFKRPLPPADLAALSCRVDPESMKRRCGQKKFPGEYETSSFLCTDASGNAFVSTASYRVDTQLDEARLPADSPGTFGESKTKDKKEDHGALTVALADVLLKHAKMLSGKEVALSPHPIDAWDLCRIPPSLDLHLLTLKFDPSLTPDRKCFPLPTQRLFPSPMRHFVNTSTRTIAQKKMWQFEDVNHCYREPFPSNPSLPASRLRKTINPTWNLQEYPGEPIVESLCGASFVPSHPASRYAAMRAWEDYSAGALSSFKHCLKQRRYDTLSQMDPFIVDFPHSVDRWIFPPHVALFHTQIPLEPAYENMLSEEGRRHRGIYDHGGAIVKMEMLHPNHRQFLVDSRKLAEECLQWHKEQPLESHRDAFLDHCRDVYYQTRRLCGLPVLLHEDFQKGHYAPLPFRWVTYDHDDKRRTHAYDPRDPYAHALLPHDYTVERASVVLRRQFEFDGPESFPRDQEAEKMRRESQFHRKVVKENWRNRALASPPSDHLLEEEEEERQPVILWERSAEEAEEEARLRMEWEQQRRHGIPGGIPVDPRERAIDKERTRLKAIEYGLIQPDEDQLPVQPPPYEERRSFQNRLVADVVVHQEEHWEGEEHRRRLRSLHIENAHLVRADAREDDEAGPSKPAAQRELENLIEQEQQRTMQQEQEKQQRQTKRDLIMQKYDAAQRQIAAQVPQPQAPRDQQPSDQRPTSSTTQPQAARRPILEVPRAPALEPGERSYKRRRHMSEYPAPAVLQKRVVSTTSTTLVTFEDATLDLPSSSHSAVARNEQPIVKRQMTAADRTTLEELLASFQELRILLIRGDKRGAFEDGPELNRDLEKATETMRLDMAQLGLEAIAKDALAQWETDKKPIAVDSICKRALDALPFDPRPQPSMQVRRRMALPPHVRNDLRVTRVKERPAISSRQDCVREGRLQRAENNNSVPSLVSTRVPTCFRIRDSKDVPAHWKKIFSDLCVKRYRNRILKNEHRKDMEALFWQLLTRGSYEAAHTAFAPLRHPKVGESLRSRDIASVVRAATHEDYFKELALPPFFDFITELSKLESAKSQFPVPGSQHKIPSGLVRNNLFPPISRDGAPWMYTLPAKVHLKKYNEENSLLMASRMWWKPAYDLPDDQPLRDQVWKVWHAFLMASGRTSTRFMPVLSRRQLHVIFLLYATIPNDKEVCPVMPPVESVENYVVALLEHPSTLRLEKNALPLSFRALSRISRVARVRSLGVFKYDADDFMEVLLTLWREEGPKQPDSHGGQDEERMERRMVPEGLLDPDFAEMARNPLREATEEVLSSESLPARSFDPTRNEDSARIQRLIENQLTRRVTLDRCPSIPGDADDLERARLQREIGDWEARDHRARLPKIARNLQRLKDLRDIELPMPADFDFDVHQIVQVGPEFAQRWAHGFSASWFERVDGAFHKDFHDIHVRDGVEAARARNSLKSRRRCHSESPSRGTARPSEECPDWRNRLALPCYPMTRRERHPLWIQEATKRATANNFQPVPIVDIWDTGIHERDGQGYPAGLNVGRWKMTRAVDSHASLPEDLLLHLAGKKKALQVQDFRRNVSSASASYRPTDYTPRDLSNLALELERKESEKDKKKVKEPQRTDAAHERHDTEEEERKKDLPTTSSQASVLVLTSNIPGQ